jgi:hypothetical protein
MKKLFFTPDRLWGHPTSYPVVLGALSWGRSGQGVKVTTHLHVVPRLCTRVYPKVSGLAHLTRELQMVQLSATRCSCIAILWVSLVRFAAITLYVAFQRVFIVVIYFVMTQSGNFWIHPRARARARACVWRHTSTPPLRLHGVLLN